MLDGKRLSGQFLFAVMAFMPSGHNKRKQQVFDQTMSRCARIHSQLLLLLHWLSFGCLTYGGRCKSRTRIPTEVIAWFSRPVAALRSATFRCSSGGRCWDRTNASHFHGRRFSKPLHYRSANLPLIRKIDLIETGAPGRIRTLDRQGRSLLLLSTELRAHGPPRRI